MHAPDPRDELSLVEAQLFASTEVAVISAIDDSADPAEAVEKLQALGMTEHEAGVVLEMPLRVRTQQGRRELLQAAERLRGLII